MASTLLFVIASFLCAPRADSIGMLILFRVLQGRWPDR